MLVLTQGSIPNTDSSVSTIYLECRLVEEVFLLLEFESKHPCLIATRKELYVSISLQWQVFTFSKRKYFPKCNSKWINIAFWSRNATFNHLNSCQKENARVVTFWCTPFTGNVAVADALYSPFADCSTHSKICNLCSIKMQYHNF